MIWEILKVIVIPIISALIGRGYDLRLKRLSMSRRQYPETKPAPINNDKSYASPALVRSRQANKSDNHPLWSRTWFVLCIEVFIIIYVLLEVFSPGELTRLSVYKIVIGIGLFFYLLIQTSLSNFFNVLYEMKKADLEYLKSVHKKN